MSNSQSLISVYQSFVRLCADLAEERRPQLPPPPRQEAVKETFNKVVADMSGFVQVSYTVYGVSITAHHVKAPADV